MIEQDGEEVNHRPHGKTGGGQGSEAGMVEVVRNEGGGRRTEEAAHTAREVRRREQWRGERERERERRRSEKEEESVYRGRRLGLEVTHSICHAGGTQSV